MSVRASLDVPGETRRQTTVLVIWLFCLGAAVIAGKPEGAGSLLGIALSLGSLLVFLGWVVALRRHPWHAVSMVWT